MAAADSQAATLNLVANTYPASTLNNPTFVVDQGFTSDGSTSGLTTTFVPATANGQLTQNSASMGTYSRTARVASNIMNEAGAGSNLSMASRFVGDTIQVRLNDAGGSFTFPSANTTGLIGGSRNSSTDSVIYRNGAAVSNTGTTTTALVNQSMFICGFNNGGGVIFRPTTEQLSVFYVGGRSFRGTEC